MGYLMRVRLSSFFAGASAAAAVGFYYLRKDYTIAHDTIARRVSAIHESLDTRIAALEKSKEPKITTPLEGAE